MYAIRVHTTVGTRARTRQSEHERQSPTTSLLGSEVTGERQGKLVLHLPCVISNVSPTLSGVQTEMGATQATKPNPPTTEVVRTQGKRDCCFCSHIPCLLIQAHYNRETRLPATGLDSLIWVGVQRLGVRVSCAGVCGHVVSRSVCICMLFVYILQSELVQGPDRVNTRDRVQCHFWGQK